MTSQEKYNEYMKFKKEYVRARKLQNDDYWRNTEKWLYYKYKHQNLIIPMSIVCFVMFFLDTPIVSITMIIITILITLWLCHLSNLQLDKDPWVMKRRINAINFRRKYNMF